MKTIIRGGMVVNDIIIVYMDKFDIEFEIFKSTELKQKNQNLPTVMRVILRVAW